MEYFEERHGKLEENLRGIASKVCGMDYDRVEHIRASIGADGGGRVYLDDLIRSLFDLHIAVRNNWYIETCAALIKYKRMKENFSAILEGEEQYKKEGKLNKFYWIWSHNTCRQVEQILKSSDRMRDDEYKKASKGHQNPFKKFMLRKYR